MKKLNGAAKGWPMREDLRRIKFQAKGHETVLNISSRLLS